MKHLIVAVLLGMLVGTASADRRDGPGSTRGLFPTSQNQGQGQGQKQGQLQAQGQLQGQAMQQGIYVNTAAGVEAASVTASGFSADTLVQSAADIRTAEINKSGLKAASRNRVPDAYAPPLTTSNDTCMGSSSIGGSGPGLGLSLGTTWTDEGCVARSDARVLYNMGLKAEAILRLCERPKMAKVLSQCNESGNTSAN